MMAQKDKSGLTINCGQSYEAEKEFEKIIYEKNYPNFKFEVSGVPIVITNTFQAQINGKASMEGAIKIRYEIASDNTQGFQYDSKKGKVKLINEREAHSEGIGWDILSFHGEGEIGGSLHWISKLYGSTGADISFGVFGNVDGEAKYSMKPELQGVAGKLKMAINPRLDGTLVVSVPVVDRKLKEQPLFKIKLTPFWEKTWISSSEWRNDLNWTATGEKGRRYITRFREIHAVDKDSFQFDLPYNWDVIKEEVGSGLDNIDENVIISNNRGVTVSYWDCQHELGGRSRVMLKANITKMGDSGFIPSYPGGTNSDYSSLGKFIVAKVKIVGELWMGTDSDFIPVDDGAEFFAVVPETYLGEREFVGQAGNIDEFSFEYPTPHAFIAEAPEGKFTEKEEQEVIEILKSFKIAE